MCFEQLQRVNRGNNESELVHPVPVYCIYSKNCEHILKIIIIGFEPESICSKFQVVYFFNS